MAAETLDLLSHRQGDWGSWKVKQVSACSCKRCKERLTSLIFIPRRSLLLAGSSYTVCQSRGTTAKHVKHMFGGEANVHTSVRRLRA
jgi:hypothetical protein